MFFNRIWCSALCSFRFRYTKVDLLLCYFSQDTESVYSHCIDALPQPSRAGSIAPSIRSVQISDRASAYTPNKLKHMYLNEK